MRAVPPTFTNGVAEYGSVFQPLMADNIRRSIGKDLEIALRRGPLIAAATAEVLDHHQGSDDGDGDGGDGGSTDDYGGGGSGGGSDGQSTVEYYEEGAAGQAPASPRSAAAPSTPLQMSDLVFYTDLDDSDDDDSDSPLCSAPSSYDRAPSIVDLDDSDDSNDDSGDGSAPSSDDEAASIDNDGDGPDAGGGEAGDPLPPQQQLARRTVLLRTLKLSVTSGTGPRLRHSALPRLGDLLLLSSKPALKPSDLDRSSMFSALALAGKDWDSSGGPVTVAASWGPGCLYGALVRDMHGGDRSRSICVTKIGCTISDERQYTSFDKLLQHYSEVEMSSLPGIARQLLWGLSDATPTIAVEHLPPAAVPKSAQELCGQRRLDDSQRQAVLQLLALAFRSANDRIARAALETDDERTRAIQEALQRQLIRAIHGPPGTGKSTAIVVLLELLLGLGCRALVAAPSNMAVQGVAAKLLPYLTGDDDGDGGAAAPVGIGPRRRGDVVLYCSKAKVCPEGLQPLWLDFRVQRIVLAQQEWAGGAGELKAMLPLLHPATAAPTVDEVEALVDRLQAVEVVMRSAKERLEGELPRRFLDSTASLGMPALLHLLDALRHAATALAVPQAVGLGVDAAVMAFHTSRSALLAAARQCGVCRADWKAWPGVCIQHAGVLLCTDSFCARTDVRVSETWDTKQMRRPPCHLLVGTAFKLQVPFIRAAMSICNEYLVSISPASYLHLTRHPCTAHAEVQRR